MSDFLLNNSDFFTVSEHFNFTIKMISLKNNSIAEHEWFSYWFILELSCAIFILFKLHIGIDRAVILCLEI